MCGDGGGSGDGGDSGENVCDAFYGSTYTPIGAPQGGAYGSDLSGDFFCSSDWP